jgi:CBS domain-containing protein
MTRLDKAGTGALVLCTGDRLVVGLLSDGDIRRAILSGCSLGDLCESIANKEPIVALPPVTDSDVLAVMNQRDINHLPVVDQAGILQDFILRQDLGAGSEPDTTDAQRLESVLISPIASISEAVGQLDKAGTGALVLCSTDGTLCGLLTDGDIRRAILQGKSMDIPCEAIASLKPVVASRSISMAEALHLMNEHDIHHLPVVDAENRVVKAGSESVCCR